MVNGVKEDSDFACRAALLSIPVSYIYTAYAVMSPAQYVDAQRRYGELHWLDLLQDPNWYNDRENFDYWEVDDIEAVGCPRWVNETSNHWFAQYGVTFTGFDGNLSGNSAYANSSPSKDYGGGIQGADLPDSYQRLREGVERFFITDINNPASGSSGQSTLPVMWDAWAVAALVHVGTNAYDSGAPKMNHIPGGSNVLYMDGHVEFVRFGEKFPVTPTDTYDGEEVDSWAVLRLFSLSGGMG
jgi:prepilin-type processing-associated H-X9-DG protein